jgi:hypothetical protein
MAEHHLHQPVLELELKLQGNLAAVAADIAESPAAS